MNRLALLALAALVVLVGAACGGEEVRPLPVTVEGEIVQEQLEGDAENGAQLFASEGCGGCHVFDPAESEGEVGPQLNEIDVPAEAGAEDLAAYVRSSLVNPNAYVVEGYQEGIMPSYAGLERQQIADLVAYLTESQ